MIKSFCHAMNGELWQLYWKTGSVFTPSILPKPIKKVTATDLPDPRSHSSMQSSTQVFG